MAAEGKNNTEELVFVSKRTDSGNILATDPTGTIKVFYDASKKICTDELGTEVDCPKIIKKELNEPVGWIIATAAALVIVAVVLVLYVNK